MTREIKFRVWDSAAKKFRQCVEPFTYDIKISPESIEDGLVSQYTGLKDIKGKEIYEGDIVIDSTPFVEDFPDKIREPIKFEIVVGEVLGIMYRTLDGGWLESGNDYERRLEVIGNRWENSELLTEDLNNLQQQLHEMQQLYDDEQSEE